jgi:flagellar biosynthetic protein FliS
MSLLIHPGSSSNASASRRGSLAAVVTLGLDLMLMDSVLEHIAAAHRCLHEGDNSEKQLLLAAAVEIVGELRSSLNVREGGPFAAHLDDLCDYMARQLTAADRQNRPETLDQVSDLLREVRSVWAFRPCSRRHPCMTARIQ